MFANHIKGLKQNPSYNKPTQLYTWGRKCQEALPGGVIRHWVAQGEEPGSGGQGNNDLWLILILSVTNTGYAAVPLGLSFSLLELRPRHARVLCIVRGPGWDREIKSLHITESHMSVCIVTWQQFQLCSSSQFSCFSQSWLHDNLCFGVPRDQHIRSSFAIAVGEACFCWPGGRESQDLKRNCNSYEELSLDSFPGFLPKNGSPTTWGPLSHPPSIS